MAAISAGLLVVLALVVYVVFQAQLDANLDETLTLRATADLEFLVSSTTPPSLSDRAYPNLELTTGEALLRLYLRDGTLLQDASPSAGHGPEERDAVLEAVRTGRPVFRTIDLANDEDYRVKVSPIDAGSEAPVVLVSGIERSRVTEPLGVLRLILLIFIPLTSVGAALGGYWVAMRALEPVSAMAAAARDISSSDLSRRVPGAAIDDELGHLAATLNAMIERLQRGFDREREFTANASHELRTPLAAITTTIDVALTRERSAADYRDVLTTIRGQAAHLTDLTGQLLLLSRLHRDTMAVTLSPIDLREFLGVMLDAFRESHPDITVSFDSPPGMLVIDGQIELLARALLNLLDNAARYAGPEVAIDITLNGRPRDVMIVVRDHGRGIPADVADRLFQRFTRGDGNRAGTGTGLGLAIVQSIVDVHGGTIQLETPAAGSGVQFRITLPRTSVGRS